MSKKITVCIIACFIGWSGVFGQVITPVVKRNELIEGMKKVVGNMEGEAPVFSGLVSPFKEKRVQDTIADVSTGPVVLQEEQLPEVISDETAVEVISRRFKPLGSLIFGSRGILQLANGETIEEGDSFPAEIRGNTYTVEITKVTARGYTLKVGDATIDKTFLKAVNQPAP